MLPVGKSRKTTVSSQAVAGISAPLCTACGIEPFAIAALNTSETTDFGFTPGALYTFAFECIPTPGGPSPVIAPPALTGTVVQYVIIDRWDPANALAEPQQLYKDGAHGLVASPNPKLTGSPLIPLACVGIGDAETIWASAAPSACATIIAPNASVSAAVCGLRSRFDNAAPPALCADFASLSTLYQPDTDVATGEADLYASQYIGNGRRIITVPIMEAGATMTVLGFRQFFLEPNPDGSYPNPADTYGRFVAQYIGSSAPVQQGWFDDHFKLGCPLPLTSGPGKVVLHQ
jgi:hypothetical protein